MTAVLAGDHTDLERLSIPLLYPLYRGHAGETLREIIEFSYTMCQSDG